MRLAVKGAWVLENLRRLGSGAFYHLAYATQDVHPDALARLKSKTPHGRVGVYWISPENTAVKFADGEMVAVHWFPKFVRIHFMILDVLEGEATHETPWDDAYLALPPLKPQPGASSAARGS